MENDSSKKTILIVEDDEFLRSLTAKRLEKENYHIEVAVDGEKDPFLRMKRDHTINTKEPIIVAACRMSVHPRAHRKEGR